MQRSAKPVREDLKWLVPCAVLVGLELACAGLIGWRVGFHYELAIVDYAMVGVFALMLSAGVTFVLTFGSYPFRGIASPARQLVADIRRYGWRIAVFSLAMTVIALQWCALGWTKSMIPLVTTFWADPLLAAADRAVFGTDPWRYLHAIFGHTAFFDQIYITWAPLKFLSLLIFISLAATRDRTQTMSAYFLTMLVGALLGQYALPSGGPVFYAWLGHGKTFDSLPVNHFVAIARDYLWASYMERGGKVGTGISAMPSIHVAISVWMALAWLRLFRPLGWLACVYAAVIFLGSIYLGWHYALDGIAGAAIAVICWFAVERFLAWLDRAAGRNPRAVANVPNAI